MAEIIKTDFGYLVFEGNELLVVSTVPDPPKVRLASPSGLSLGAVSFNRLRPDGRQEEMILIQGKQDERTRHLPVTDPRTYAAELTIHMNRGGEKKPGESDTMVRILEARYDGIRLDVPLIQP